MSQYCMKCGWKVDSKDADHTCGDKPVLFDQIRSTDKTPIEALMGRNRDERLYTQAEVDRMIAWAVLNEREACAQVAIAQADEETAIGAVACGVIAIKISSRAKRTA